MSATLIKKLRGDLATLKKDHIGPLIERLEGDQALTEAELGQLAAWEAEGDKLSARLVELTDREIAQIEAAKRTAMLDGLLPPEPAAGGPNPTGMQLAPSGLQLAGPTLGAAYLATEAWKRYMRLNKGGSGGDLEIEQFTLIKSQDANGKPIAGFWKARDAAMPARRTPLLDACGSEQVGTGEFWWIEWPVTAPTAGATAEGAALPEATYAPVVRNGQLGKVGHHIPLTEEFLEDNIRMQSIIEGGLADGVRQKAEADASLALVAATLPASPATGTLLEEIRRGVGMVQAGGWDASTVVLNPLDYAEIDIDLLTKTLNGARANSPLWALNVVPAGAVASGTAYVGDFLAGARVFWRAGVRIQMTDSHDDEFIEDTLRIKATQRLSTKIVRPEAIVECAAAPATP